MRPILEYTATARTAIASFFEINRLVNQASHLIRVGEAPPEAIPHPLDVLPDSDVDLRRSGIVVGDALEVTVALRPSGETATNVTSALESVRFVAEATLAGLHSRYSADVIFVRPVSAPASTDFKAGPAIDLELHYFDRTSPNSWWNLVDPAVGIHAAFLDLDPSQAFELGAGAERLLVQGIDPGGHWLQRQCK